MPLSGSYITSSRPTETKGGSILEKLRVTQQKLDMCNRQKDEMMKKLIDFRVRFASVIAEKAKFEAEMNKLKKAIEPDKKEAALKKLEAV